MSNGFLGYNASLMLDVVVCALVLVVPALLYSIYLVKIRHNFVRHRFMQVVLGVLLLATVGAFEIDLQIVHGGWETIVNKTTAQPRLDGEELEFVRRLLWFHLIFAISTPLLWATTLTLALKRLGSPPTPGDHSPLHKKLAWLSAIDLSLTSITGLVFYYFAFVVSRR